MASAVASNLPAAAAPPAVPVPYGWLSPRASFSRDAAAAATDMVVADPVAMAAAVATPEPAISKDFIDFEFSLGGSATMLPADELFADGKLLPLRKRAVAASTAPLPDPEPAATAPSPALPEEAMPLPAASTEPPIIKPLRAAAAVTAAPDGTDPYAFSPKAPSCSSRWRELLGLKRAAAAAAQSPSAKASPSPAPAKTPARATNSAAARSLKLLLQRNTATGRASAVAAAASDLASAPLLLRDSSDSEASLSLASSRFSLSSSSSSSGGHDHDDVPRFSLDSAADPNPPRIRLVRRSAHTHSHHRHSTSSTSATRAGRSPARRRPSPPRCVSVDSPRMNSSGKIVFHQGLERSSSSPCSFHAAASKSSRSRAAVDRSYSYSSGGVRVAPVVLNVPVCSRPVFGFFKDKKDSGAAKDATAAAAARSRSSLGRRAAQGWSGELAARSSGG